MPDGNRYAAALAPPNAGPPPDAQGPPQGPMPPDAHGGAPPQPQDGAQPNPALVEALQILQGHEGKVADLLKDPASLKHVRVVFEAVKQDPGVVQALGQQGIGPDKLQQFDQMLTQAERGGKAPTVPHWLAQ